MPPDRSPPRSSVGSDQIVEANALMEALSSHARLPLILLDACHTQSIASRLADVMPAVIGYRQHFEIASCEIFVAALYRSLLQGQSLAMALTAARQQLDRQRTGSREWGQAILYMQTLDALVVNPTRRDEASVLINESFGPEVAQADRGVQLRLTLLEKNLKQLEETRIRMGGEVSRLLDDQIAEVKADLHVLHEKIRGSAPRSGEAD
jgi:hypothetical protein